MRIIYLLTLYTAQLFFSGCTTFHDSEISKFNQGIAVLSGQDRIYKNKPSYVSKESAYFGGTLGSFFGDYSNKFEYVRLTKISETKLLISYYDSTSVLVSSKILNKDFELRDKKIILSNYSSCASRDSPGVGCQWSSVTLSENGTGDLSAVKNGGGAGLIGLIVPIGVSYSYLAIYPRVVDISKYPQPIVPDDTQQVVPP